MVKNWFLFFMFLLLFSCKNSKNGEVNSYVKELLGKIIKFPNNLHFTSLQKDTLNLLENSWEYAIVSYADAHGCLNCTLQLDAWKKIINQRDSIFNKTVEFLFFLHPNEKKKMLDILVEYGFNHPVCIDENDDFNKQNHCSSETAYQTFLIDKNNKVVAVGNPIHNPKVKELYLKIIQGEKVEQEAEGEIVKTELDIDKTSVSLGNFDWQNEQKTSFILKNKGTKPLVIQYVNTSCGCTKVSYSQEPVQPGGEITLNVTYKADHPEYFSKTITVYCNTKSSLIKLTISGNAQ